MTETWTPNGAVVLSRESSKIRLAKRLTKVRRGDRLWYLHYRKSQYFHGSDLQNEIFVFSTTKRKVQTLDPDVKRSNVDVTSYKRIVTSPTRRFELVLFEFNLIKEVFYFFLQGVQISGLPNWCKTWITRNMQHK